MSDSASPLAQSAAVAPAPLPAAQPPPSSAAWPQDCAEVVLILQHSERVPPAYVAEFLQSQQQRFHVSRLDLLHAAGLPSPSLRWKAIVSLGGPQGSYEEELHPWLADEKRFLLSHADAGTPILGICLGCQLLADAVGGKVYLAERFEAGYARIGLTDAGKKDRMLAGLYAALSAEGLALPVRADGADGAQAASAPSPSSEQFLLHHGDTFDLPPNVELLARSSAFKQIFRYKSALGVQFHPEASVREISAWSAFVAPRRYESAGTSAQQLVREVTQRVPQARRATRIFFEHWWKDCGFQLREPEQEQASTAQ